MDRRQFLATSGLAAASPMLMGAAALDPPTLPRGELFKRVNFQSDGLALDPREYITQLGEALTRGLPKADNYSNGGLIAELEQKFAQLLGKEAAMFVPTGTLANHLAIRKLAGNDHRVLVQAESHFYNDSGDCAETLSGLSLVPLGVGRTTVELSEIASWVERSAGGRVKGGVGVISIESPVRRRDHEFVEFGELERISKYARAHGIRLHLDGARLFNLPLHTGKTLHEYGALFDTVYVSLWKHFNGACGAILAGDAKFIEGLFHTRRMFGCSLPQAWPEVALVMRYVDTYQDDYARAWRATDQLFALLASDGRFTAEKLPRGTSKFHLTLSGIAPDVFVERLAKQGIDIAHAKAGTTTIPLQVNTSILRSTPERLTKAFVEASRDLKP